MSGEPLLFQHTAVHKTSQPVHKTSQQQLEQQTVIHKTSTTENVVAAVRNADVMAAPRGRLYYRRGKMYTYKDILKDFSRVTSSHGIPQIAYAKHCRERVLWIILFTLCVITFSFQAYSLVKKFFKYEKTVQIEVRFEAAPFPVFDHVKKTGKDSASPAIVLHTRPKRKAVSADAEQRAYNYEPVLAFCTCVDMELECSPIIKPIRVGDTRCMCFRDVEYDSIWPCFHEKMWTALDCEQCSATGRCTYPIGTQGATNLVRTQPCLCQHVSQYCAVKPRNIATIGDESLFTTTSTVTSTSTSTSTITTTTTSAATNTSTWRTSTLLKSHPSTTTSTTTQTTVVQTSSTTTRASTTTQVEISTTSPPSAEMVQSLGYENMTDEVAIVTKAKENLVFTMASMEVPERVALSYSQAEFLLMCSFNGEECNKASDFELHVDPVYGNCYTYNWNNRQNKTSSRAGPMYGLRLLAYTDTADYMPTTEAAGVRLQVHQQTEFPFPDTFGYSAPVGMISSFGIKLKSIKRMPKPFGDCVIDAKGATYIYKGNYSTEGCFRSCFQQILIERCGCGDPRFPVPTNQSFCKANNQTARGCLAAATKAIGDFQRVQGCVCHQPCRIPNLHDLAHGDSEISMNSESPYDICTVHQMAYGVVFSAAQWPASTFEIGNCNASNTATCVNDYRNNAALLEVYYEQLNLEVVEESQAYGLVALFADFGGQLGLWMGFSVMTLVEFTILIVQLVTFPCWRPKQTDQAEEELSATAKNSILQVAERSIPRNYSFGRQSERSERN